MKVWVGIFSVVAASVGITAAFRHKARRLMMAFFVLSIVGAAAFTHNTIAFSSIGPHADDNRKSMLERKHERWFAEKQFIPIGHYHVDTETYHEIRFEIGAFRFNFGFSLLLAILHLISAIVSLSLVCHNWSKGHGLVLPLSEEGSEGGGWRRLRRGWGRVGGRVRV